MNKPKFDIIIISHNALIYLKKCLWSIQRYTKDFDYEITVVDNASADGTKEYLKTIKGLQYIFLEKNFGPSKAFNAALKATSNNFIVRIDDDTEVSSGWLHGLYKVLNADEKIAIAGPKTIFKNGHISFADDLVKYPGVFCGRELDYRRRNYVRYCDVVSGSGMLFKRSLIEEIGYFDEQLNFYDDTDFGIRCRIAGYKIVYNGKVTLLHHYLFRYRKVLSRQRRLFLRKWDNLKEFPLKDSHPADRYNTMGLDCLVKGNYKKAFHFFKKIEILDKRLKPPFFMAVALWGMGRREDALTELNILLKKNPSDYRVRHFFGLICLKNKNYKAIFKLLKKNISSQEIDNFHPELNDAVYRIAMSN